MIRLKIWKLFTTLTFARPIYLYIFQTHFIYFRKYRNKRGFEHSVNDRKTGDIYSFSIDFLVIRSELWEFAAYVSWNLCVPWSSCHAREPLYLPSAVIAGRLQSTRTHNVYCFDVPGSVEKGVCFFLILWNLCLAYFRKNKFRIMFTLKKKT